MGTQVKESVIHLAIVGVLMTDKSVINCKIFLKPHCITVLSRESDVRVHHLLQKYSKPYRINNSGNMKYMTQNWIILTTGIVRESPS